MRNFKILIYFSITTLSCNSKSEEIGRHEMVNNTEIIKKQDMVRTKIYALDINIDFISIAEYEMNFISSDKVELKRTIYCNSLECITSNKQSKESNRATIRNYKFKEGFLNIEGMPDKNQISILENGDIQTINGEPLNTTSITQVDDKEKGIRIAEFFKGNKALAKVFTKMLSNASPKALITPTMDGQIKFN